MNFGEVLISMIWLFFMVIFFWMFITVFADVFRRDDISGWGKAGWILLMVIMPFLGILIYMIARPKMTEQDKQILAEMEEKQRRLSGYSAADEIDKAKTLLDKGAISQTEFDEIKRRALA